MSISTLARVFTPHGNIVSLVSYTRHDYFRRILCNMIGGWVERGEVPDNNDILTRMIKNICHDNAKNYFKF